MMGKIVSKITLSSFLPLPRAIFPEREQDALTTEIIEIKVAKRSVSVSLTMQSPSLLKLRDDSPFFVKLDFMYLKLLLSFGLLMIPSGLVLAQETQPTTKHIYPQDFVSDYLAECQELAIAEDLLPEDAKILCDCTINSFQNKYSFEEYQQLDQETKEEVGYDCFDQLLYEDEETQSPS